MKIPKKDKGSKDFDYAAFEKEVVSGLQSGQSLLGAGGLLKPLIAKFVETALDAELTEHIKNEATAEEPKKNKRNGKRSKEIRTEAGHVKINYSRDRNGTFEPITVGKRQYEMSSGFDAQILELYAMSNSLSDIRVHLEKMYGARMSEARISSVINSQHGNWLMLGTNALYLLVM